jgi:CRISPR-associated protein Csy1
MAGAKDNLIMEDEIEIFFKKRAEVKETALLKDKPREIKITGAEIGGINTRLLKLIEDNLKVMDELHLKQIADIKKSKNKNQTPIEFQREKYVTLVSLASDLGIHGWNVMSEEYNQFKKKNDPVVTLSAICKNASRVSFATHVAKLTHSRIKGASNILDTSRSVSDRYLVTASLSSKEKDRAWDNSIYMPISELLSLECGDKSLADYVREDDEAPFKAFTSDTSLIKTWIANLKKGLVDERKSSHTLAKQVYWPVKDENDYHLLMPVVSSTLAQAMHLNTKSYEKANMHTMALYRAGKYSSLKVVFYPKKAILKVTASEHRNVSNFNIVRKGKLSFLSCSAPIWSDSLKPPAQRQLFFEYQITSKTEETVKELQKLLFVIKSNQLSTKSPKIHIQIQELIDSISKVIFGYIATVQSLKDHSGWSENSILKLSHQLLMDIYRDDKEFQQQRKNKEWKLEIVQDFGDWLNSRLKHKKLQLGPIQAALWRGIFKIRLREFLADTEAN